jgi:D-3-phosphoglycerate dehydrogenase / 2-oxoglutarate reductase
VSKVRLVVTDYVESNLDWEAAELSRRGVDYSFHQLRTAPQEEVVAATRDADVVIANFTPITSGIVSNWNRCRLAIRHGTGYDNFDVTALDRAGIPLCYIPDYCTEEVAEHAIALILGCGRRLAAGVAMVEEAAARGRWNFGQLVPMHRMSEQRLGIIGCGRIGSRVYLKLKSFGFTFLICDPYLSAERRHELAIDVVDKETVFRESDFVSLHVPLTDETRHMVDAGMLSLMKPTAYVINTARGPVVDTPALAQALRSGKIAGAGIDVFDSDPPPADCPLFELPNLTVTPHSAWYSEDAAWTIRQLIMLEIDRFLAGLPPRYVAGACTIGSR